MVNDLSVVKGVAHKLEHVVANTRSIDAIFPSGMESAVLEVGTAPPACIPQ